MFIAKSVTNATTDCVSGIIDPKEDLVISIEEMDGKDSLFRDIQKKQLE